MSGINAPANDDAPVTPEAIVASGRWALLGSFGGAAFWLAVAGILGLIASIKMHSPGLLAGSEWFSYGRLKAASAGAFNFGFATQAAVGVALWLVALLGRSRIKLSFLSMVAGKLWNIGVLLGVVAVLYGDLAGHPMIEFPRYAMGVLLFAYIGMAVPVFVTFHHRSVRELYPSLWFVVAALFWFAWLLSTAVFLLQVAPVRGVLQAAVEGWFANGFATVWLFPMAIAVMLYLRPMMSESAIVSRATILLGFWTLAFLGPWGGIAAGTPLPAWVGAVSTSLSSLLLIPILAVFQSVGGMRRRPTDNPFDVISWKLADYSFLALVLFGVLTAVNSFAMVYRITQFTFVITGLQTLAIYGVGATALFAAAFQILPRVVPPSSLCPVLARVFSIGFRSGTAVLVLSLLLAGQGQGRMLANPEMAFIEATNASKMWFRLSTIGDLFLALAGVLFFGYVIATALRLVRAEYRACEWCGAGVKAAEVAT
jgi:cytochrome c oxidase cbb3-type subunit 1